MKPRILSTARLSFPLATAIAALLAATSAHAANIWDGGGADTNWGTVANWDNNLLPTYGTLTFSGIVRPTNVNNLFTNAGVVTVGAGTLNMSQLNFNSATPFTISGNAISLFDNGGVQSKIENNGAGLATINLNTTFAATAGATFGEINAINGNLTFGTGTLTVNGSQVAGIRMFGGGRTTTFNGTVSASGKYFATTAASTTVAIGGAFTSGDFYLMNNGTLRINAGGTLTTSGSGSPALRLGGDFTTTGSQNLAQGATFQLAPSTGGLTVNALINTVGSNTSNALLIDSLNTSGTNTLAGDFYLDSNLRVNQASGGTITISDTTTDIKGQSLILTGTGGNVNLTGVVGNSIGSGQVVVGVDGTAGGPTVTMSQANTYGGQTFVRAGTLAFTSAGSAANSVIRLGSTSGTTVTAGVNLTTLTGLTTISSTINAVTTSGSGALSINSNNTSGTNTLSGQIALDRSLTITQAAGGTLNITQVKGVDNTTGNDIKGFTETFTPAALGTINVSGTIYNSTGSGNVVMSGAGTLVLSNANTYTGATTITTGTLSIPTINTVANANPLGQSANTAGNLILNGGTLQVTGGAAGTTDRLFSLQSSSSIDASGSAALIFSNTGSMGFNLGVAAKTLTLTGSNTNANSIAAIIGDNTGLTSVSKNGVGNWTLSGNNSYTGTTGVSNGTLIMSGNNTLSGQFTVSGNTGATLTLSGNNSGMSGNVVLSTSFPTSGTASPRLNINSATGLGTGTLSFGGGAAADTVRLDNTSGGAVIVSTTNAFSMGRNFTFIGTQSLNLGNGTATIGSASRTIIVSANTLTLGGVVTETTPGTSNFGITLGGNGTLSLTNEANTFSGKTVIGNNAGSSLRLRVSKLADLNVASSLGAPTTAAFGLIQIGATSNSSVLELVGSTSASTTDRQIQIGSSANGSGNATIQNNNTNALHTLTFSNPAFNVAAGSPNSSNRSVTLAGSNIGDNTITGAIINNTGGSVTVNKTGTGTWVLNGTSSFTGAVAVTDGILKVNSIKDSSTNSAVGAGSLIAFGSVSTTGTLAYTGAGDSANRPIRLGSTTVGDTGGGVINNDGSGALIFTATAFISPVATITAARNLTIGGTYTAGTNQIQGVIANNDTATGGIVSITKAGAGTWALSGVNTYTGTTTISGGQLTIDDGSIATSSNIVNNAALEYKLNVNARTYANVISGSGTLTKTGTNTLTLTNASNSYAGATSVTGGILEVTANNALGTNAAGASVTAGAALQLTGVTYSTAEALSLNGTGISNGGALVNSGTSSFGGQVTAVTNASINAGGGTLSFTGGLVKNGTVLTLTGGGTVNVDTVGISGSSANSDLIVSGVTLNANVANTYNGPTFIRSTGSAGTGIFNANIADALPTLIARTAVTMDDSGLGSSQLNLAGGANQAIASLTGAASSLVNLSANTLTIGSASGSTTFAGGISGSGGSLVKDSASTQILSGDNTYTGATTISGGTLQLGTGSTTGSLSTTSAIVNDSNLTINRNNAVVQGTDFSGADITGTGSFTQAGAGTSTLNVANTFSGGTSVTAGTLLVNNTTGSGTGSGAVTIGASGTLGGSGIISGNTTINGNHRAGNPAVASGVGTQSFGGNLSYGNNSIFNWDLNANEDANGVGADAVAGTDFDSVAVIGDLNVGTNVVFNVIFGTGVDLGNAFWSTPHITQEWSMATIFGKAFTSGSFASVDSTADPVVQGSFTITNSGSTLTWTAVPEPTSALAGLLIAAGLLRRRRV